MGRLYNLVVIAVIEQSGPTQFAGCLPDCFDLGAVVGIRCDSENELVDRQALRMELDRLLEDRAFEQLWLSRFRPGAGMEGGRHSARCVSASPRIVADSVEGAGPADYFKFGA